MLPQTNLQLYRVLVERGELDRELAQVRAGYDLARRLFAGCYRPSHKPFICHLVGTAGALAMWGQSIDIVTAGLLHSAYLYGDFGDGVRGVSPRKRRSIEQCIGSGAESLINAYTQRDWSESIGGLREALLSGGTAAASVVIKLADLCDECADAGPAYAPAKPLEFGLPDNLNARSAVLELVEMAAGVAGRKMLAEAISTGDGLRPPGVLTTSDRSFHSVTAGAPRSRWQLRTGLLRIAEKLVRRRAA